MRALLLAGLVAVGWANASNATTIDFNSNPDDTYGVSSVNSNGFTATENVTDDGRFLMGTNSAIDKFGPSNGSVHLDSWTNKGSQSIWTLTQQNGTAFSITQFDFESGAYDSYQAASSLTVTAQTVAGNTVSQAFGPAATFTTRFLTDAFSNVLSVTFDATGYQNRAGYDNIVVNVSPAASVPEPASFTLLSLGVVGFVATRRRRVS